MSYRSLSEDFLSKLSDHGPVPLEINGMKNADWARKSNRRRLSSRSLSNTSLSEEFISKLSDHEPVPLKNRRRSSTRSVDSTESQETFGSDDSTDAIDNDGKKHIIDKSEFADDIEEDPSNISASEGLSEELKEVESFPVPSTSKPKRDGKKKNRDRRHPQLNPTDELGRTSSHYKLDGVYSKQKPQAASVDLDNEEEIEVLTKGAKDSNDPSKSSNKSRFRTRRRDSTGKDESTTRTRSRSREERSRSRKESTRNRSAKSLERLAVRDPTKKSNVRRMKKSGSANPISPESEEGLKQLFGSDAPHLSEEDTVVVTNTSPRINSRKKLQNADNPKSDDNDLAIKQRRRNSVGTPGTNESSKDLAKRLRRRCSTGGSSRKERMSTQLKETLLKDLSPGASQPEEDPIVVKNTSQTSLTETETTGPESQSSSLSSMKSTEDISKTNDLEENVATKEQSSLKELEKKQRRRDSTGKSSRKERSSARLSNRSGHGKSRKSTREKKSRRKDSSAAEEIVENDPKQPAAKEIVESDPKQPVTTGSTMNGIEDNFSSSFDDFMTLTKEEVQDIFTKKSQDSGDSEAHGNTPANIDPQGELNDVISPNATMDPTHESKEENEETNENKETIEGVHKDAGTQATLNDLFSKDSNTSPRIFAPSIVSEETEQTFDPNYLQLNFGTNPNNLFALMDEKINQSVTNKETTGKGTSEEDRDKSHSSFVSFTEEIDLKVSSQSVHDTPNICLEKAFSSDDGGFSDDGMDDLDDGFAHESFSGDGFDGVDFEGEIDLPLTDSPAKEPSKKVKKLLTPTRIKKVTSSLALGLSKSMHPDFGRHLINGDADADGLGEDLSPRRKKKQSMLKKMKKGVAGSGRRTFQKAQSTRNLLGQATTKVLARRKEEGRGLLKDDSDSDDSF